MAIRKIGVARHAGGVLRQRPLHHAADGEPLDIVLVFRPLERAHEALDGLGGSGREVVAPVGVDRDGVVERQIAQHRQLAVEVFVDDDAPRRHALDELAQQLLPLREARIGNRLDDDDLVGRRHREHVGDELLGLVGVGADDAGEEPDVNAGGLDVLQKIQIAHGPVGFGEALGLGVVAIIVDPLQQDFRLVEGGPLRLALGIGADSHEGEREAREHERRPTHEMAPPRGHVRYPIVLG